MLRPDLLNSWLSNWLVSECYEFHNCHGSHSKHSLDSGVVFIRPDLSWEQCAEVKGARQK